MSDYFINLLSDVLWVLLVNFGTYKGLLGYPSCTTYFIRNYSAIMATFIFIVIVKFGSHKFSNTHSQTHVPTHTWKTHV